VDLDRVDHDAPALVGHVEQAALTTDDRRDLGHQVAGDRLLASRQTVVER